MLTIFVPPAGFLTVQNGDFLSDYDDGVDENNVNGKAGTASKETKITKQCPIFFFIFLSLFYWYQCYYTTLQEVGTQVQQIREKNKKKNLFIYSL